MAENFVRFEKKYLLDDVTYQKLLEKLNIYVVPSRNNRYHLRSLYYDNENNELIINSINKPCFKEKLRIRSYSSPTDNDQVYVEIKRKYAGIVYKRRTRANYGEVLNDITSAELENKQVEAEVRAFITHYGIVKPKIFISSRRTCYEGIKEKDLRITFDEDIKYRCTNLYLKDNKDDQSLMDKVVMEIKVAKAMPLWLSNLLMELNIKPQSNSKVGRAYIKEEGRINGII